MPNLHFHSLSIKSFLQLLNFSVLLFHSLSVAKGFSLWCLPLSQSYVFLTPHKSIKPSNHNIDKVDLHHSITRHSHRSIATWVFLVAAQLTFLPRWRTGEAAAAAAPLSGYSWRPVHPFAGATLHSVSPPLHTAYFYLIDPPVGQSNSCFFNLFSEIFKRYLDSEILMVNFSGVDKLNALVWVNLHG